MNKLILISLLALTGCTEDPKLSAEKADYRSQEFEKCMKLLPAGPQSTHYNDWSEVVDSCASRAYYQMNTRYP